MSRPEFPLEAVDSGSNSELHAVRPEALDASDRRLEALQAEAHLLQDSLSGQPLRAECPAKPGPSFACSHVPDVVSTFSCACPRFHAFASSSNSV